MAILKMKKAFILANKQNRKPVLELLQRLGVMEISPGGEDDTIFAREDASDEAFALKQSAQVAEKALALLDRWAPEQSGMLDGLAGRKMLTAEEYAARATRSEEALQHCEELLQLEKQRAELAAEIPKVEQHLIALQPWLLYDLPLNYAGTEKTAVFTGTLPNEVQLDALVEKLKEQLPETAFDASIVSAAKEQTCIFLVCGKKDGENVFAALRKIGFSKPPFSDINPAAQSAALTEQRDRLLREREALVEKIRSYAQYREAIRFAAD